MSLLDIFRSYRMPPKDLACPSYSIEVNVRGMDGRTFRGYADLKTHTWFTTDAEMISENGVPMLQQTYVMEWWE